eukprot:scaffold661_cov106-Cylindrotheca_fusiformis.AAC.1
MAEYGLSSHLNFSKERSCLQYYLSNHKGFYDNKANFKINLESSLTNAEKELRSTGEVSATDRKNVEDRELLYLKDNYMLWNQKIGTLPSEIQQKFGILSQSSMQLGLDEMFCSVPNQVTSPGKDLLNLTVPDHEVTNDRLVAHFPPRALYEYLDEQYELQETNGGDDSASASSSSEEEDVEEDEEASSDSASSCSSWKMSAVPTNPAAVYAHCARVTATLRTDDVRTAYVTSGGIHTTYAELRS